MVWPDCKDLPSVAQLNKMMNNANDHPVSAVKSNSSAGIVKERKSPDDVIFSLRCELRTLYDSLSDKNDQLVVLERDVRDRDISIRFLKSEFKKLLDQQKKDALKPASTCKCHGGCSKINQENTNLKKNPGDKPEDHLRGQDMTGKLQKEIRDRDYVIVELNQKVIMLTEKLSNMQEELTQKSERVIELQNEIDKFRQVVRPLTQHMIETKRKTGELDDRYLGMESTRVLPLLNEPRMKRTAISAEPLSLMAGLEGELLKIPKTVL